MKLLHDPELFRAWLGVLATNAWGGFQWYFDVFTAFAVTFFLFYGFYALIDKLRPVLLGGKPRVWGVPVVFAVSLASFPLFMDHVVTSALRRVEIGGLWPEVPVSQILAALWALGFVAAVFRLGTRFAALRRTTRKMGRKRPGPTLRAALAANGMTAYDIELRTGPPGTPVFSCGVLKPLVVIPADFAEKYSGNERLAMYLHECVHIRNRDALKQMSMAFVGCVFWFDPVMRRALSRMRDDMEALCDWAVVDVHHVEPAVYAALIVKAAAAGRPLAAGFSDSYRRTAERLGHVLRDREIAPPARLSRKGAFCCLAGLTILFIAGVVAAYRFEKTPTYTEQPGWNEFVDMGDGTRAKLLHARFRQGIFASYGVSRMIGEKTEPLR